MSDDTFMFLNLFRNAIVVALVHTYLRNILMLHNTIFLFTLRNIFQSLKYIISAQMRLT